MSKAFTWQALVVLVAISIGVAQAQTASINGSVTDPTAAAIPDAHVTVASVDTGSRRETTSNDQGYYSVPLLQPGNYRVTVQKEGFRPISRSGITLEVEQAARINFVMEIGTVVETVDVVGAAPMLESRQGEGGGRYGQPRGGSRTAPVLR